MALKWVFLAVFFVQVFLLPGPVAGLEVGEGCTGPSDTSCVSGSSCVDIGGNVYQCRIRAGSSGCGSDYDKCATTTTCEADTCKLKPGYSGCGASVKCVTSAVCESSTCKLTVGQQCTGLGDNRCTSNAQCADLGGNNGFLCRIKAGYSGCGSDDNKCVTTATCESDTCKLKIGQGCTGDSDNRCTSNTQCVVHGNYNQCKLKIGQECTGDSDNGCASVAQCVAGGNYYQCRKSFGLQCSASNECQTSQRQTCVEVTSGGNQCLCNDPFFRLNNQCQDVTTLKATDLRMSGSHQETDIAVMWTPPVTSAPVLYKATLNTGQSSSGFGNATSFNFTGLTQGTAFTFHVTSRTERNPGYSTAEAQRYTTVVSDSANIYTKPAQPGPLYSNILPGPDVTVTFIPSAGHVDTYRVTVTPKQGGGAPRTLINNQANVTVEGLERGLYYNVSIIAISNNINSDQRTTSFRVRPNQIKAGFSNCSSDRNECEATATCENDTCKLKAGSSGCDAVQCETSLTCESDTCRITVGSSGCGSDNNKCGTTATCDADICRLKAGQGCTGANDNRCTSNAQCADVGGNNFQCRLKAGSSGCGSDGSKCVTNATCQSNTCRIKAGSSGCGSDNNKCGTTAICQSNTCKIKKGSSGCGSDDKKCVTSTTCKSDKCSRGHLTRGDWSGLLFFFFIFLCMVIFD